MASPNPLPEKRFLCPQCGASFLLKAKVEGELLLCRRHKQKIDKGTTDCVPCRQRRINGKT